MKMILSLAVVTSIILTVTEASGSQACINRCKKSEQLQFRCFSFGNKIELKCKNSVLKIKRALYGQMDCNPYKRFHGKKKCGPSILFTTNNFKKYCDNNKSCKGFADPRMVFERPLMYSYSCPYGKIKVYVEYSCVTSRRYCVLKCSRASSRRRVRDETEGGYGEGKREYSDGRISSRGGRRSLRKRINRPVSGRGYGTPRRRSYGTEGNTDGEYGDGNAENGGGRRRRNRRDRLRRNRRRRHNRRREYADEDNEY